MGETLEGLDQLHNSFFARKRVKLAIYHGTDRENLTANYSVNLSIGGVFVETSKIVSDDEHVHVEFYIPHTSSVTSCKSRVAWINDPHQPKSPQLPAGMGLQFIDLPFEEVMKVRRFLSEI